MAESGILKRLEEVEKKYEEIEKSLSDPNINPAEIHRYSKERSEIAEVVEIYREYKKTQSEIASNEALVQDSELADLARAEIDSLEDKRASLEEKLRLALIPRDPNDSKDVILEIRAGTGGEEAALFAGVLFRMYSRYAERNGWKTDVMSINETGIGGIKEAILSIEGKNVYSKLKHESGVHRVQRVPSTEASGRIHTSTATVAVLAEPDDLEVSVDEKDLRVDTFRASGAGGQHVNKTDSAIRITHVPTGIVVQCQDERSQHKNRAKAMRMLRAKLYEAEELRRHKEISSARRGQVGTGDRSEKIRTYNFPQSRVTDHRIGLTLHSIETILDGELSELIETLITYYQAESLKKAALP